jgi:hypothetical protein
MWAFAAGAAVVVALVLVPLILLGGPREDDEPAVTSPVTIESTSAVPDPSATPTTIFSDTVPSVTVTAPHLGTTTVTIDDLAAMSSPAAGAPVAEFEWGEAPGQIGRNARGDGPCCFDITSDGTVVVLDPVNLRLVMAGPRLALSTIAEWDASDFTPTAMVIAPEPRDDVVFVLGMTNRPGRPHDLISMKLDGTVIERGETIVRVPGEMVESAGSIWAVEDRSDGLSWIQLATRVGDVSDIAAQVAQDSLLLSDRSALSVDYPSDSGGVKVALTPPGGQEVRYEIDLATDTWGHFALPFGDGILVWAWTTEVAPDGSVGRVAAVVDEEGTVVDGLSWQGSQSAETGPVGVTRLGPDGALYDLASGETGLTVRRFPLSRAAGFDALVAQASLGNAMTAADRTLWIAGPYMSDQQGEWGELLEVDLRTKELVAVHEVPVPMNALSVAGNVVWAARAGDGGLPDNVLIRLDSRTDEIEVTDLGQLSTNDLAATETGVWVLAWAGGDESPSLAFVDGASGSVGLIVDLPVGSQPSRMQRYEDVLWIASLDGQILRYDIARDVFLEPFDVGFRAVDVLVEEDLFGSDLAVWVTGLDGEIMKLRSDGSLVVDEQVDEQPVLLAGGGAQGTAWGVSFDGAVHFLSEGSVPILIEETGVSSVSAMVFDGGRLWVLGDTLHLVMFGQ